jgi:thioesterase domain-containing protein
MICRRCFLLVAVLASTFAIAGLGPSRAEETTRVTRTGHVYLFRGFANVFSTGMNVLTENLRQNGIKADVYNHAGYPAVAKKAIEEYRATKGREPIFIVGHSLGGDAAIAMSEILQKSGVPVTLLVIYDAYAPRVVPSNVRHVINYHQYEALDSPGAKLKLEPGFKGKAENIDVAGESEGIDHFNIDKQKSLHEATIKAIISRTRRK